MYRRYNNSNNCHTQGNIGTWCCNRDNRCEREENERSCWNWCEREENKVNRKHWCRREEDENENSLHINTNIQIDQEANANGGDGGDGGEAEGGDTAFAEGGLLNFAINELEIDAEIGFPGLSELTRPDAVGALQDPNGTTVAGGEANAYGGNGGNASATNVAEVTVENVIIIVPNYDLPIPTVYLGSNGNNIDVKIDKDGNAFVNGNKLDAQELDNGSKVLIFRDNKVKKEEKKR